MNASGFTPAWTHIANAPIATISPSTAGEPAALIPRVAFRISHPHTRPLSVEPSVETRPAVRPPAA